MGVSFLDHDNGVAVGTYTGSAIVRTDDGGETWTLENPLCPLFEPSPSWMVGPLDPDADSRSRRLRSVKA